MMLSQYVASTLISCTLSHWFVYSAAGRVSVMQKGA